MGAQYTFLLVSIGLLFFMVSVASVCYFGRRELTSVTLSYNVLADEHDSVFNNSFQSPARGSFYSGMLKNNNSLFSVKNVWWWWENRKESNYVYLTINSHKKFQAQFHHNLASQSFFRFFYTTEITNSFFFFKQKIVFPRLDKDYVLSCIWYPTFKIFNYDAMKLIQEVDNKTLFRKFCQILYIDIFPFFRRKQNSFHSNAPDWCLMKSINYHRLVQAFNG